MLKLIFLKDVFFGEYCKLVGSDGVGYSKLGIHTLELKIFFGFTPQNFAIFDDFSKEGQC